MSARERILARLRQDTAPDRHAAPPRPALSGDPVQRFIQAVQAAAATLESIADRTQVPAAVQRYQAEHHISGAVALAPALARLDWPDAMALDIGTTDGAAQLAVSQARAGIAETGSLVLVSGPDTPTRLNFLPEHQIVVLEAASILRHLDDALSLLDASMPRALNLVTGPSRTADVEQTLQLGAHGPRALHVLLVGMA
jgi:L-lactate dehydrogenase complex protein LldG